MPNENLIGKRIIIKLPTEITVSEWGYGTYTIPNESPYQGLKGKIVGQYTDIDKNDDEIEMYEVQFDNSPPKILERERMLGCFLAFPIDAFKFI